MTDEPRLFHGGAPGLRAGDLIRPGHSRQGRDDCPLCVARAAGGPVSIDGPSLHADRVYLTTVRLYAAFYASLYGRGDLYRVEPVGEVERSTEDSIETYLAPAARVIAAVDRAVLLTWTERRRLFREWTAADREFFYAQSGAVL